MIPAHDPYATVAVLRAALERGDVSAEDACRLTLERIETLNPRLHAFLSVDGERALERARALDRTTGPRGPLHGIPVAIKDNIAVRGGPTTAGSRMLEHYVPPFDATVVDRLARAGAVVVGKTVCDEFAMGSSTEHCAFGPSRNPWDPHRTPGGSSGGSAVAVAAGMAPVAIGSDTGGSIRQPAALSGVVGLKPTYGRVSRYGLLAFASSLDQIGPLGRSVADVATCVDVIAGADPRDATTRDLPIATSAALTGDVRGLRIGVPERLLDDDVDEGVMSAFRKSLDVLTRLGARTARIELPHAGTGIPVYYLIATAEASSNLARYDGVRYGFRADADSLDGMYQQTRSAGFGLEAKRRIMLGTYVLSAGYYEAYYQKAQQVRTLIARDYTRAFDAVDVIALPTSPTPAFGLGERTGDPLVMYRADVFTVGAPLAGLPALSVPCGFAQDGLPVGLQLIGRAWDEGTLLRVGDAYERATSWHLTRPPLD